MRLDRWEVVACSGTQGRAWPRRGGAVARSSGAAEARDVGMRHGAILARRKGRHAHLAATLGLPPLLTLLLYLETQNIINICAGMRNRE